MSDTLRPTTPSSVPHTGSGGHSPIHRLISPVQFTHFTVDNLPASWTSYENTRGSQYFRHAHPLGIATTADMMSPVNQANMERGIIAMIIACQTSQMSIPNSVELFLCQDGDDGAHLYYFVDHQSHRVFWLDGVDLSSLGLHTESSEKHKFVLEELYWTHIENFPSHEMPGFNLMVDQARLTLERAHIGLLFGTLSFPFDAQECAVFLHDIDVFQGSNLIDSKYAKCFIARIWSKIAHHKAFLSRENARTEHSVTLFLESLLIVPEGSDQEVEGSFPPQGIGASQQGMAAADARRQCTGSAVIASVILLWNLFTLLYGTGFHAPLNFGAVFSGLAMLCGALVEHNPLGWLIVPEEAVNTSMHVRDVRKILTRLHRVSLHCALMANALQTFYWFSILFLQHMSAFLVVLLGVLLSVLRFVVLCRLFTAVTRNE